jgi:hypothetical protein
MEGIEQLYGRIQRVKLPRYLKLVIRPPGDVFPTGMG